MIATAPHKRDTIRMGARMEAVSPHSCLTRVRGTLVRSSDKRQRPGRDPFLRCRTDGISDAVLQWEAGSGYSCSAESNYTDRGTLIWLSILFQGWSTASSPVLSWIMPVLLPFEDKELCCASLVRHPDEGPNGKSTNAGGICSQYFGSVQSEWS